MANWEAIAEQRATWREIRWKQQGGRCFYCENPVSYEKITLDHVIPLSKNGRDALENTVAACHNCNRDKGDKTLEEFVLSNAARVTIKKLEELENGTFEEKIVALSTVMAFSRKIDGLLEFLSKADMANINIQLSYDNNYKDQTFNGQKIACDKELIVELFNEVKIQYIELIDKGKQSLKAA